MQDPQCEFLTYETIQTYRGHKPDRTVVLTEKHDMVESEAQKSPCAQRFLRSTTISTNGSPRLGMSVENLGDGRRSILANTKNQPKDDKPVAKKTVSIVGDSLTPPVSKTATPQRIRRSQSLSAKRSPSTSTFNDFEKACLKAHNEFRQKHSVQPLKLSKRLCRFSEEWAKVSFCNKIELNICICTAYLILQLFVVFTRDRFLHRVEHQSIDRIRRMARIYFVRGAPYRIWLSKAGSPSSIGTASTLITRMAKSHPH